jgi:putative membrane protein
MKLSPLSVPYRVLERGGSLLVAAAFLLFSGGSMLDGLAGPLSLFALLGVGVLLLIGYEVAYYQRYEYELTTDTFDIHSGVFARRDREIPLRRIQNVDISRNVVQRVLGLAAVSFETAGGSETEASLRFVSVEEATRLQREVPRLKRGGGGAEPEEPEPATELFALSQRELTLVGVLSFDFRVPGVLALVLSGSVPAVSPMLPARGALPLAAFVLLLVVGVFVFSWAAGAVAAFVNYYDFHLVRAGEELQYERGLLQRYNGSIPFDKVQTLTVEDTPLKRYFGYATLLIETAGYAPGQSSGGGRGSEAAVPLATRDRVFELANAIDSFGAPELNRPPKRVRRRYAVRYLLVVGVLTGLLFAVDTAIGLGTLPFPWYLPVALLPVIPPAAHLKWTHRGYWLGDDHVVTRNGVWNRQTKVVPYDRIQTVIDSRTLFQRRWNLATVTVDTAGSLSLTGGDAAAVDVDDAVADDLRAELDERLRAALAERRRVRQARRRQSLGGDPGSADTATDLEKRGGGFVWGGASDERDGDADRPTPPSTAPTDEGDESEDDSTSGSETNDESTVDRERTDDGHSSTAPGTDVPPDRNG